MRKRWLHLLNIIMLLLGVSLGSLWGSPALGSPLSETVPSGGTVTACTGKDSGNSKLSLGGRSVPSDTILRISATGECAINENSFSLVSFIHTIVLSPNGPQPTDNGAALLKALALIPSPSATRPYLIKLEPGVYDLGTGQLQLRPFVDIEGTGEDLTVITAQGKSDNPLNGPNGTVVGASNSELRFLTIQNRGGAGAQTLAIGVYAGSNVTGEFRLFHTTIRLGNVPANSEIGLYNKGGVAQLEFSRVMVNSPNPNYAILTYGNSVNLETSRATAGGSGTGDGLFIAGGQVIVRNSILEGNSEALINGGGTALIAGTQLSGPVTVFFGTRCVDSYKVDFTPITNLTACT